MFLFQFPGIECISTAFVDEFPVLRKYKPLFTLSICTLMFLLGIPCVTQVKYIIAAFIYKK